MLHGTIRSEDFKSGKSISQNRDRMTLKFSDQFRKLSESSFRSVSQYNGPKWKLIHSMS